jgi:hypothetical protein
LRTASSAAPSPAAAAMNAFGAAISGSAAEEPVPAGNRTSSGGSDQRMSSAVIARGSG